MNARREQLSWALQSMYGKTMKELFNRSLAAGPQEQRTVSAEALERTAAPAQTIGCVRQLKVDVSAEGDFDNGNEKHPVDA